MAASKPASNPPRGSHTRLSSTMIRAAQSALSCAAALEEGNRTIAYGHLSALRDALTELERLHLTYGEDLKALRRHEQNLTARMRGVALRPSSPPVWTDEPSNDS